MELLFVQLAHGVGIGREDLPIPVELFTAGAITVLVVSFWVSPPSGAASPGGGGRAGHVHNEQFPTGAVRGQLGD